MDVLVLLLVALVAVVALLVVVLRRRSSRGIGPRSNDPAAGAWAASHALHRGEQSGSP